MKKILSAVLCAVILFDLTSCKNSKETAMLKPEIKIGNSTVILPCAIKDIDGVVIDEGSFLECDHDGIDALYVRLDLEGSRRLTAGVTLDNRDKVLPVEDKTIVSILLLHDTEFCGIRLDDSRWTDVCGLAGQLDHVKYGNLLAPLENGYYFDCLQNFDNGMVSQMEVYTLFDNAEYVDRALAKYRS